MSPELKAHIISAVLTFLTGFLLVFGQGLLDNPITVESLQGGSILGLILVSLRAGLKLAVEPFIKQLLLK